MNLFLPFNSKTLPTRAAFAITFFLLSWPVCHAQTPSNTASESLTLSQVTSIALTVSPTVRAAQETMAQARARVGQAQAQRRYQVTFNSTASVSNGDVYLPPPPSETFAALQNTITIPLPVSPKLSAQELQAQALYSASEAQVAAAQVDAAASVQNAYFDLLKQQALLSIAQENENQAQAELDAAKKRYADGAGSQLDILKAQVPLITAQGTVLQAQSTVQVSQQTLDNQLQRSLDNPLQVEDITDTPALTVTLEEARSQAVANSADVRAAQANVDAAQAALRAARLGRSPELSLQASDALSKDLTGFSRLDTIGISVTVPLSDGGLVREQINEAQAALDAAQTALLQAQQTAELNAGTAFLTAQGALAQVGPTQQAADIAKTTLDKTNEGYLAGLNPIFDVLNAQLALNQARIAHAQALYDAASAVAALNRAMGKVMP